MLRKLGVQSAGGCVAHFVQVAETPPRQTQSLVKWLQVLQGFEFMKEADWRWLKHMPWSAWEHGRACVPAAVWWPPLAAAWHGSYRELKDTCATEPQELECLLIHLRSRCLDFVGCVRHSLAEASTSSLSQLKHWWDGFLLWLWLRLLFADTFLKSPCEGGRLKHMPWSAWEHGTACVPTAVWWLHSCCLTRKLSRAEGHLRDRTPRAWMPFDSAWE